MDCLVRNYRTLKAKAVGILFGTKYSNLKKFRIEIQRKV